MAGVEQLGVEGEVIEDVESPRANSGPLVVQRPAPRTFFSDGMWKHDPQKSL